MKIAIIGSRGYPYVYSGYETFVKELAERLAKKGFHITVYNHRNLFHNYPKIINGIHLIYVPTVEKKTMSQFIHSLQAILHASIKKYDIVLVLNSANGPLGIFTRMFHARTAINVDGLEWLRPKWKGLGAKYFYWASLMATKFYDLVITDSLEMQKIYKNEFNCDSTIIAYGANIRESKNPELIKKWSIKEFQYYLIVGRLIPDNNVDVIIREFTKTNSLRKLVIVGDVPYRDSYSQSIKAISDPRLVFTGYIFDQDELAELYHHCYVYLHGHEFGGTNPALLNALAYGCAVCALNTAFNREVLKNGKYGVFFTKAKGNLKNMINHMENNRELLENMKKKSRERIKENYTWEKITNQYVQLFERMARNR